MPELYPWQSSMWSRLVRSWDRLPQGLLLSGPLGVGKRDFAMHYINAGLCETPGPDRHPCGHCHGCLLFRSGSHPDVLVLMPEADLPGDTELLGVYAVRLAPNSKDKPKTVIGVDQVRDLIRTLATTPHTAPRNTALIAPAEGMNANAANALLKLLEEPTGESTLLLISENPYRLPATVRSRCVELRFAVPDIETARDWLAEQPGIGGDVDRLLSLAKGAPLRASRIASGDDVDQCRQCLQDTARLLAGEENPVRIAARWRAAGTERNLRWLHDIVADLLRIGTGCAASGSVTAGGPDSLQRIAKHITVPTLFSLYDKVADARRFSDGSVDSTLLLEDVLLSVHKVGASCR